MALAQTAEGHGKKAISAATPHVYSNIVNVPDTTGISVVGLSVSQQAMNITTGVGAVTLGGATVTKLTARNSDTGTDGGVWIGYVLNSATGTGLKSLSVTFTVTGSAGAGTAGCICYSGQHATTPFGTAVSNASAGVANGTNVDVTDAVSGDIVVSYGGSGATIATYGPGGIWTDGSADWGSGFCEMSSSAASGSTNVFLTNSADWSCIVGVALKPAASNPSYTQTKFQVFNDDGAGLGGPPP